jgi:hypothetical protein
MDDPTNPSSESEGPVATRKHTLWYFFATSVAFFYVASLAVLMSTGTTGHFLWLFEQTISVVRLAWPVTVPLAIWGAYFFGKSWDANELNSRQLMWLVPLFVSPVSMLVWGAVFEHPPDRGFERWQVTILYGTLFLTIAIAILAVISNRGRRSFVAAVALLAVVFSFSCAFVAGCSVTGDWP